MDFALEQGKDVYAVPGGIYSEKSVGCNELIKEGAGVLLNTSDIIFWNHSTNFLKKLYILKIYDIIPLYI